MTGINSHQISAVILAGGMGRRMGGMDKGQLIFNGRPLIEYVLKAIEPQVKTILINANRHQTEYARYGYPVVPDELQGYQGPLAGFASGMRAASTPYVVTLPCDGPFSAPDLVARLATALQNMHADLAVAHDGVRLQPVYALLPTKLLVSLEEFLASGERKIDRWYAQHNMAFADFSDAAETFRNINTPQDQQHIQQEGFQHD
ncbi:MAG: molybdenum cofactor guanylyltransferase MobA [Gammaproteobacteria bacterium]